MISNKTVVACSLMFSVSIGLFALGNVTYHIFPPNDPFLNVELKNLEIEQKHRLTFIENMSNDEFFYDRIKETDVYEAFVKNYPTAEITKTDVNDTSIVYTLFYTDYKTPYGIIMIDYEFSIDNSSPEISHTCLIESYSPEIAKMPTLFWVNAEICQDHIEQYRNGVGVLAFNDEYSQLLLESFEILQDLIASDHQPISGVSLLSVELDSNVILLDVFISDEAASIPIDVIEDEIFDLLDDDVILMINFVR